MAVRFIWPVAGTPIVTRGFAFRSALYYGGQHAAIDIVLRDGNIDGAPVLAIADGILFANPLDHLSGYNVYIEHADGWRSGYRHFDRLLHPVNVPIAVKQGDVIGFADSTGTVTGPHLHFDLWNRVPRNERVFEKLGWFAHDPEEWLGKEVEEEDEMLEITLVMSTDAGNNNVLIWTPAAGFRQIEFADLLVISAREKASATKVFHVKIPEGDWQAARRPGLG